MAKALHSLQDLHDQLIGLSPHAAPDQETLRHLATESLPVLERLAALDMSPPWQRQIRASRELVEMAALEAAKPIPQWREVMTALNAALYPWAHLPQVPKQQFPLNHTS